MYSQNGNHTLMLKTQLVTDEKARLLMKTPAFLMAWKGLVANSNGFNAFQEPSFVITWYDHYSALYQPVLALAYNQEEKLVSFMGLAWHKKSKFITHAGAHDAEYHGWLSNSEFEIKFLKLTFQSLQDQFSISIWKWGWLPSADSEKIIQKALPEGMYILQENRPAPVWDLSKAEKLRKFRKSKSIKSKISRYKRRGNYRFEIIDDNKRFQEVLSVAKEQYDFRQEASFNEKPFTDDPNKESFCIAIHAAGVAHASVLWLDDKILSFHLGVGDKNRVCLGINSYDPTESKQSPGTLLLIELAETLLSNGYVCFDLTPGSDSYKDRFANNYNDLARPTIYFNSKAMLKGKITLNAFTQVRRILAFFKLNTNEVRRIKNNLLESLQNIRLNIVEHNAFKRLKSFIFNKEIYYLYQQVEPVSIDASGNALKVDRQKFMDLQAYSGSTPFLSKRLLFSSALRKFNKGETLFTVVQNERLEWFVWMQESSKPILPRFQKQPLVLAEGCKVLYDFYSFNEEGNNAVAQIYLEQLLSTLMKGDQRPTFFLLDESNQVPNDWMQKWQVKFVKKISFIRLFSVIQVDLT